MHLFDYKNGELYAEHVAVKELVHEYGTPLYIYSGGTLRRHFQVFDTAFAPTRHLTKKPTNLDQNYQTSDYTRNYRYGLGASI